MYKKIIPIDSTFKFFFYFMQERMDIFWRKIEGEYGSVLTDDPIFQTYKFTNVYRATDRTSQYLLRNVIYDGKSCYTPQDVLLRILVFKIFNRIETWEYIESALPGVVTIKNFDPVLISRYLSERQQSYPIFSNAYMMTGSHHLYNYLPSKHEKWLTMVKREFIQENLFDQILEVDSLKNLYDLLCSRSFIGEFLAYQFSIDMNYSPYLNFSEDSFVKAGIGAIRGIKKCFSEYGDKYEDAIYYVYDNIQELRLKYGYDKFRSLPGREPSLIDLQNCFCETDKYLRVRLPELRVGNIRIKQKYRESNKSLFFYFPPKWNVLNENLCIKRNLME